MTLAKCETTSSGIRWPYPQRPGTAFGVGVPHAQAAEKLHGVEITDPYRWLEALDRPDKALVVVEDAVAVEKGGRPKFSARTGRDLGISSRARRPV